MHLSTPILQLEDLLMTQVKNGPQELNMHYWMSRISLELIGQGGLGLSLDPLESEESVHAYTLAVRALL